MLKILFAAICGIQSLGKIYSPETLVSSGVSMRDNMYYCESLKSYIKPNDDSDDVKDCQEALRTQKICSESAHTSWVSGRCFCPELNRYFPIRAKPVYGMKIKLNEDEFSSRLKTLSTSVQSCHEFQPREYPFGRSVYLSPINGGFKVEKISQENQWDNRADTPGEQGNPHFGAKIASMLGLDLGFGYDGEIPLVPDFKTFTKKLAKISKDVSFFEVDKAFTGREYLENFIRGRHPIARIEANKDVTYFLHDMNFHALAFMLLPEPIRELSKLQTYYLLDFIDDFSTKNAEINKPQFKLMMQKLIEDQVGRIDVGSGNLVQFLYDMAQKETSFASFLSTLANLDRQKRSDLHESLMAITDGQNGFSEKKSVVQFLKAKQYLVLHAFDESDRRGMEIFKNALLDYIDSKASVREFNEEIAVDSYGNMRMNNEYKPGISAVELFIERIHLLKNQL
jgi:hypothetical protein